MNKPLVGEYPPYYETYFQRCLPEVNDVLVALDQQHQANQAFLRSLSAEKQGYRYAEGKWTIRQVIQHILDCERVMGYRFLRIVRGDQTPLPGFDEDAYAEAAPADDVAWEALLDEWAALRQSHLALFRRTSDDESLRTGTANGHAISARAIAAVVLAHELHHLAVIREKYLNA